MYVFKLRTPWWINPLPIAYIWKMEKKCYECLPSLIHGWLSRLLWSMFEWGAGDQAICFGFRLGVYGSVFWLLCSLDLGLVWDTAPLLSSGYVFFLDFCRRIVRDFEMMVSWRRINMCHSTISESVAMGDFNAPLIQSAKLSTDREIWLNQWQTWCSSSYVIRDDLNTWLNKLEHS